MNNTNVYFVFVVLILAALLLFISYLLAVHNPDSEKDSVFECGFHSFLGQNRSEFSISFFVFALLFLLFDLEILLAYPFIVSNYNNETYGLVFFLIFMLVLTLGLVYEMAKKALNLNTKITHNKVN